MSNQLNYETRPAKHVERKIFIETLQSLRSVDYNIPSYHYIGFGSIYYVDYILFHRFLSINQMTSLENDTGIKKRVKFNKPYKFINLAITDFSSYVSSLRNDKKYFVWLDYQSPLDADILTSLGSLVNTVKNGSIIIITVNAQLNLIGKTVDQVKESYQEILNPYCGTISNSDITSNGLPLIFARSINAKIKDTLSGRVDDDFFQLFNYVYKDGARMLTFGGIVDEKNKKSLIEKATTKLKYLNKKDKPEEIFIPNLTSREKLYLDTKLGSNNSISKKLAFELSKTEISSYVKFAKHYPSFHEVFMG